MTPYGYRVVDALDDELARLRATDLTEAERLLRETQKKCDYDLTPGLRNGAPKTEWLKEHIGAFLGRRKGA